MNLLLLRLKLIITPSVVSWTELRIGFQLGWFIRFSWDDIDGVELL
jgi:hypothetical protein